MPAYQDVKSNVDAVWNVHKIQNALWHNGEAQKKVTKPNVILHIGNVFMKRFAIMMKIADRTASLLAHTPKTNVLNAKLITTVPAEMETTLLHAMLEENNVYNVSPMPTVLLMQSVILELSFA